MWGAVESTGRTARTAVGGVAGHGQCTPKESKRPLQADRKVVAENAASAADQQMEGCCIEVGGETSEGMCVGHCVGVYGKGSQEGRAPQEKTGENCATVSCACCHVRFFFCVPSAVDCFLLVEEFLTFFFIKTFEGWRIHLRAVRWKIICKTCTQRMKGC